ncbi:unnamed protein product [Cyclocybe aegerita]|uniref:DUF221-domain-containing protein n=1 Tax=Cyclocybe aegerita TaxID=1973307 RepID=A0A8S0W350_CYCAE|nr:unnamed protein product [Cyclocybe aegerita]
MASIIDGSIFDESSRTLAPAAVGSQVALMSIISVVTVLLFNFLRPKNKIIYEPKVKYHEGDKPPPRISDSLFGWLPPLVYTKEPELLDKIGLDAVAFLRFLRLLRWLFAGIALLACGVLIPINVVYNLKNVNTKRRDILSMLTIRDVQGDFLFAHVAVTYLITCLIVFCVNMHWKAMVRLRHTWFRSPEYLQSFYARTLQVRHVPKKLQSDEGLKAIFESINMPYPTTSVHIGRKVGKLPELIEYHNQTVRDFEEVLVKYLKGGKIKAKRPTIRIGGTCGCGGTRKDAIDFYTAKLKRTEAAIEEYRKQIDTRKAENFGFASMAAVPYAHIVARKIAGKHPKGTDIDLAPNPKDIIWSNMDNSEAELARNRLIGVFWLVGVCFFNTVPLFIISILANLDSIRVYVPFLQSWFDKSPQSFAFLSGVLPPAISGLFGFFLPIIMRWLSKFMGALTHSKLDRAVVARYFAFLIISQLIIFTLIGVIFNSVQQIILLIGKRASFKEIIDNLHELPDVINRTYINQASYWLTFFPLRGFLVVFDLAQIINLVWLSFKTHVFGRTPRDIREWTQPPEFQYAIYYSNVLFMGAVGLVFAPLAPLVVLAAAIVFWMSSWVYKYQLMFVFVSKVESGGRIWNVVINRLLVCVVLMQLLMMLTIGLQYQFRSLKWLSTVPPILIILAFKLYINRVYVPAFNYFSPTEEEIRLAKVHSERADHKGNRLEKRFGHPALHAELFTPMLHKKMMPLLSEVYHGKINNDHAKLDEYGGQQMEAQIVPGGIKIAAIDQRDLEYDPVMYQRDRGELDWDQRSVASTAIFNDLPSDAHHYPNASSKTLVGYEKYLAQGSGSTNGHEIEMTPIDSMQEPLLDPRSMAHHQQGFASQQSLTPSLPPSMYQQYNGSTKEASLYRPQERSYSPSPTYVSTDNLNQGRSPVSPYPNAPASADSHASYFPPQQQHQRQVSGNMLASTQRSQSPGPYNAVAQYPPQPQQHGRQASGNMLNSPQTRTPSPGPNQAYGQQHSRQASGNMLAGTGTPSPGPYQAYGGNQSQMLQQQHARQMSGNMLSNRTPSPGPYQAYAPQQQHARQGSGNMLGGYSPTSPPGAGPQNPQQQSGQPANFAGRGAHRPGY